LAALSTVCINVRCPRAFGRDRKMYRKTVSVRRKMIVDGATVWRRVNLWGIYDQTVRQDTATANEFDNAIGDRFITELQIDNPPVVGR